MGGSAARGFPNQGTSGSVYGNENSPKLVGIAGGRHTMSGGPRLPTLPRNPFATAARRAVGQSIPRLPNPSGRTRDEGLTRIAQWPTLGTLLHSRKSLGPCETIRPASGFNQLHAPIVDLDRGKQKAIAASRTRPWLASGWRLSRTAFLRRKRSRYCQHL